MDVSIIIVNHNSKEYLRRAVRRLFDLKTTIQFEVIVCNNGSDGSSEALPQEFQTQVDTGTLKVFQVPNHGFGVANNFGAARASGEYILIHNPDVELSDGVFEVMLELFERDSQIGLATCKLVLDDGTLDPACRRSEPNPYVSFCRLFGLQKIWPKKFGTYNLLQLPDNYEGPVDAVNGAFMFMRKSLYEKLGGFDEQFFMYGEDLDLCRRVREAGLAVWFTSQALALHHKGQPRKTSPRIMRAHYEANWLYYKKHYRKTYPAIFSVLVYVGNQLLYRLDQLRNTLR